jgi:hypothetical protein
LQGKDRSFKCIDVNWEADLREGTVEHFVRREWLLKALHRSTSKLPFDNTCSRDEPEVWRFKFIAPKLTFPAKNKLSERLALLRRNRSLVSGCSTYI